MKISYVGNFSQQHCTEVHLAATLESLGHSVIRIQENNSNPFWQEEVLNSDLFLFTRTWGNLVTIEHLENFKNHGVNTVSYHLDLYIGLKRQEGLKNDPFWRTDFVFTPDGDPESQKIFESMGINHFYMKPGVFKNECKILEPNNDKTINGDIVFVGSGAYMHKEWPYRKQLIQWLKKNYKTQFKKYGHPERTIRNEELNQLYSNSKVVVGDSLCLNFKKPYYWSDRVYETLGRGGFIIHPYIKGMDEEFKDGENIVFYDFNNWNQLKEKIDFYLAYPARRKAIQNNGFKFVKNNSTYHNRLSKMLEIVTLEGSHVDSRIDKRISNHNNERKKDMDLKINLGCGEDQFEGFINVDLLKLPGVDVVHNLMEFPYPFEDNSASEIKAVDVIEHLDNYTKDSKPSIIAFIEECYRILKPGGQLYIQTPGWKAEFLWIDPTHVRGFDKQSMDFFDPSKPFGQTTGFYSKAKFNVRVEELENYNLRFYMEKI